MKPIRLFRHVNCSIPGYLCSFLEERQIPFEIACIGEGAQVPDSLHDVSGLIFMGGPGDVNSPVEWMHQEQDMIRKAAAHGSPVMGVCLGAQMISKALGGTASSNYQLEVGWHHVEKVSECDQQAYFDNLQPRFGVFQWHAHDFSLPPGATLLLTSRCTPCQAFSIGNILAMQFHLELTPDTVRNLAQKYTGDLSTPSDCVQTSDELCDELDVRIHDLRGVADIIYSNWLEQL